MQHRWLWWMLACAVGACPVRRHRAWLLWMTLRPNAPYRHDEIVAGDLSPLTQSAVTKLIPAHVLIGLAGPVQCAGTGPVQCAGTGPVQCAGTGNVVVFVPLGAALALALGRIREPTGRRLLLALLIGSSLSLIIAPYRHDEVLQATTLTRVSSLDDWLLNSTGIAIGASAGCWIQNILWRKVNDRPDNP